MMGDKAQIGRSQVEGVSAEALEEMCDCEHLLDVLVIRVFDAEMMCSCWWIAAESIFQNGGTGCGTAAPRPQGQAAADRHRTPLRRPVTPARGLTVCLSGLSGEKRGRQAACWRALAALSEAGHENEGRNNTHTRAK